MAISKLATIENVSGTTVVTFGPSATCLQGVVVNDIEPLLEEATNCQPPRLLIDLEGVDFFNSSFIELLVRSWNQLKHQPGGRFALCNVHPYCHEVLEVTSLTHVWDLYPSRKDALAALGQSNEPA